MTTGKEIYNMTFDELRNELYNCNGNQVKEHIIRNIMFTKYQKHLTKIQQHNNQIKKINETKKIIEIKKVLPVQPNNNNFSLESDSENNSENNSEKNTDNDSDIDENGKDELNNTIMERLNNDIDIKNLNTNKKKKSTMIPPYIDNIGDMYASWKFSDKNLKSFSNK